MFNNFSHELFNVFNIEYIKSDVFSRDVIRSLQHVGQAPKARRANQSLLLNKRRVPAVAAAAATAASNTYVRRVAAV